MVMSNVSRLRFISVNGMYTEIIRTGLDMGEADILDLKVEPDNSVIDPVESIFYEVYVEDKGWQAVSYHSFMVLLVPANKARDEHGLRAIEVPEPIFLEVNDE